MQSIGLLYGNKWLFGQLFSNIFLGCTQNILDVVLSPSIHSHFTSFDLLVLFHFCLVGQPMIHFTAFLANVRS